MARPSLMIFLCFLPLTHRREKGRRGEICRWIGLLAALFFSLSPSLAPCFSLCSGGGGGGGVGGGGARPGGGGGEAIFHFG